MIKRDFTSPLPTCKLVGDITYLRTREGRLYLATVIDLCTRMVVGWAMSERMTAGIVVEALERAWRRGYVAGNAIFHSDRGSQYTSRILARWADEHDVRLSVGRTGSCHGNAVAESFFGTLKNEMYSLRMWATREDARNGVIDYIERRYNRNRPPLHDRLPGPREGDGRLLREDEAGCGKRRRPARMRGEDGSLERERRFVSEILTQLKHTKPAFLPSPTHGRPKAARPDTPELYSCQRARGNPD